MTSAFEARLPAAGIRAVRASDRAAIEDFLRASENFTAEEVETALELIDEALAGDPEYIVNVLSAADGRILGYECHGPASLTDGTYDLYWIAVDKKTHARGVGSELLKYVESDIRRAGGRQLLIETSSLPHYELTRKFYLKHGYEKACVQPDYYADGDDMVVFRKRFV